METSIVYAVLTMPNKMMVVYNMKGSLVDGEPHLLPIFTQFNYNCRLGNWKTKRLLAVGENVKTIREIEKKYFYLDCRVCSGVYKCFSLDTKQLKINCRQVVVVSVGQGEV